MSTFDLRTPISLGRLKATDGPQTSSDSLEEMIRRRWPDLPAGAKMILLPREDFEIILAATEGRPIFQTRGIVEFAFVSRKRRTPAWLDNAVDIALKTAWIIWGVFMVGLIAGAWR